MRYHAPYSTHQQILARGARLCILEELVDAGHNTHVVVLVNLHKANTAMHKRVQSIHQLLDVTAVPMHAAALVFWCQTADMYRGHTLLGCRMRPKRTSESNK